MENPFSPGEPPKSAKNWFQMNSVTLVKPKSWSGRRRARWKHGLYSAEVLAEQKHVRELLAQSRELLKQMQAG
jgi:hypothetical protein